MADFSASIRQHKDLPEDAQKKAGQAISGKMNPEHYEFLKLITSLLKSQKLNVHATASFFKEEYSKLTETDKSKVDLATLNIADLLRHIADFYLSKKTPDESPQLMTMIDQLLQMKKRVESKYGDVYIF